MDVIEAVIQMARMCRRRTGKYLSYVQLEKPSIQRLRWEMLNCSHYMAQGGILGPEVIIMVDGEPVHVWEGSPGVSVSDTYED